MSTEIADTSSIDALFQKAVAAYREAKLGAAEVYCRNILARERNHIAALQLLAAVAANSGAAGRGIELLQKVLRQQPRLASVQVQLAKLQRSEGRIDEATAALNAAIELEPNNAAAHNDLGLLRLAQGNAAGAIKCFDRALANDPAMAIAAFNRGLACERLGLFEDAGAAFRHGVELKPDFAEAYAKLGNLSVWKGDKAQSLDCFRRAVEVKPDSVVALMCRARLLMEEQKADEAEPIVRRAIERSHDNSDAHALLGSILMELGRFEDAASAFDLALALNRRQIAAWCELIQTGKLRQRDRALIAQLEWMLKENALADTERAHLHFALGKAYDDLAEFANAIVHFDAANQLKRRKDAYNAHEFVAVVDRMVETFTPEFFARNAGLGSDCGVPLLIVGMPRSGTTLVEQILSSHPLIAPGGELPFWSERAQELRISAKGVVEPQWATGVVRDYRTLLTGVSATSLRVTDKWPLNFNLLGMIHTAFPRGRFIHCRRNGVDTCLSIYFQNFAARIDFAHDRDDLAAYYRQYERLMEHWRSVLPADIFMEVQYEELVANPEPITRKMIEFCGLEWDDACLSPELNPRSVRTASLWQVRQPVYRTSVARWRNYEPWLGPLRELLPDTDRIDTTTT